MLMNSAPTGASLIAQAVLADPQMLSLVRLCGVREMVAFALGAILGDIHRFAEPKKLVKYIGLNPAFDDSGEGTAHGGIAGHGNPGKDLRSARSSSPLQAILLQLQKPPWHSGARTCCGAQRLRQPRRRRHGPAN